MAGRAGVWLRRTVTPIQRLLPRQGVDLAHRCHPTHDREVIARQLLSEDRRPPHGSVGFHHPWQEVKPGFVHENQDSALEPRPLPQLRPDFIPPALDGFFIPLDGPPDRRLGRPTQFPEQAGNMAFVIGNSEFLLDNLGDSGAGPNLTAKPISLWPMLQKLRDQTSLGGQEL